MGRSSRKIAVTLLGFHADMNVSVSYELPVAFKPLSKEGKSSLWYVLVMVLDTFEN